MNAIIVGYIDYADEDRIVKLLTEENGLISAIAKKARSSHRKFGGSIDIGNSVKITVSPPKSGDLWKLTQATIAQGRYTIRRDILKISLMIYLCEISSVLSVQEQGTSILYGLLEASLALLDNSTIPNHNFHIGFTVKALAFAGLRPNLLHCAHCLSPIENPKCYFQPLLAGPLHEKCLEQSFMEGHSLQPQQISRSWLLTIKQLLHRPLAEAILWPDPKGPKWLLASVVEHHIEKPLLSKAFLHSLLP